MFPILVVAIDFLIVYADLRKRVKRRVQSGSGVELVPGDNRSWSERLEVELMVVYTDLRKRVQGHVRSDSEVELVLVGDNRSWSEQLGGRIGAVA